MAGLYPDVPAPRIAYDIDGTSCILYSRGDNLPFAMTTLQKTQFNDETNNNAYFTSNIGSGLGVVFIFPTNMIVSGYVNDADVENRTLASMSYSTNTTNGVDGTWTLIANNTNTSATSYAPKYRTDIVVLGSPVTAKAIKFEYASDFTFRDLLIRGIHLYGSPATNTDLEFWHPTLDQALTGEHFDFGDVAQGSAATKSFRLKNFSTSAAGDVVLSLSVLSEKSPTIASQHQFSLDQSTWTSSLTLPETSNIAIDSVTNAPNNFSPIIYFRRNLSASSALGLYAGRIVVDVGQWI